MDEAAAARAGGVACADIEWRRRDDPATRGVLVLGAAANVSASALQTVADFPPSSVLRPNATVGTVCFRADGHSGRYAVYWLPFAWSFDGGSGSYHSHFLAPDAAGPSLPAPLAAAAAPAAFLRHESYSDFDTRSPMELAASEAETRAAVAAAGAPEYLLWV